MINYILFSGNDFKQSTWEKNLKECGFLLASGFIGLDLTLFISQALEQIVLVENSVMEEVLYFYKDRQHGDWK